MALLTLADPRVRPPGPHSFQSFSEVMAESLLLERAFSSSLVIPDFADFSKRVAAAFAIATDDKGGDVARYIPQLASVT